MGQTEAELRKQDDQLDSLYMDLSGHVSKYNTEKDKAEHEENEKYNIANTNLAVGMSMTKKWYYYMMMQSKLLQLLWKLMQLQRRQRGNKHRHLRNW